MTLDEAIQHARDVAREERDKLLKVGDEYICSECGKEYEQLAKWLEELKEYKQLEEQGLLLKLPCKIGDTVYVIGCKYRNGTFEKWINTGKFNYSDLEKLNNTVFLTKEEAEQELKRLEGAE